MSAHDFNGVVLAALAVSMGAMVGELDPMDVDELVMLADQLLDRDDPLRAAVTGFGTQYLVCRRDKDELFRQGKLLGRAVELAVVPTPPDMGRSDVHG